MKRRVTLEIHREDHKTDALGRVFLGAGCVGAAHAALRQARNAWLIWRLTVGSDTPMRSAMSA